MTFAKGKHLIADFVRMDRNTCLDSLRWVQTLTLLAQEIGMTTLNEYSYDFTLPNPAGFTAYVLLDASHFSVHTYADEGKIALDLFACGVDDIKIVFKKICQVFKISDDQITQLVVLNRFGSNE